MFFVLYFYILDNYLRIIYESILYLELIFFNVLWVFLFIINMCLELDIEVKVLMVGKERFYIVLRWEDREGGLDDGEFRVIINFFFFRKVKLMFFVELFYIFKICVLLVWKYGCMYNSVFVLLLEVRILLNRWLWFIGLFSYMIFCR